MKLLKKLTKNIAVASNKLFSGVKNNFAELYTMAALFVAVPVAVGLLADWKWGLLLSVVLQAVVGVLYIVKGGK